MSERKPDIIDQLIHKAAEEIAQRPWPGFMDEPITEEDIDRSSEELAKIGIQSDPEEAKRLLPEFNSK